jgi:hypothetical protein
MKSLVDNSVALSESEQLGSSIGRSLNKKWLLVLVALAIGFGIYLALRSFIGTSRNVFGIEKSADELKYDLQQKESSNPVYYVVETTSMRSNLVGKQIIEGSVMNNASVTSFKDVVLEVSYLSKTGSVISTERFTIYEVAAPGKWASFKFKTSSPRGTKEFSAKVIAAAPL